MKKWQTFLLILILSMFIACCKMPAFAIEDWSDVYETYDEAEYGKVITGEEFQNAMESVKNLNKKGKKDPHAKSKARINQEKEKPVMMEFSSASSPLFALPVDVNHEGKVINRGFYLVQPINQNDKHFIRFTQGEGQIVADFEANVFKTGNIQKISDETEKIFSEIIREDLLKVTYSNRNYILEAYLWIQ